MEVHDRPNAAGQHRSPTARPARRPDPERRDANAGDGVRAARGRMAERDDPAVVDASDPLDEIDDGRQPRLVPLDREARHDHHDPQPGHEPSPPETGVASAFRYATTHSPSTIHAQVRPAVGAHV